jgi:pimeloyl-ACP methyl ester carboxylesterase
MRQTAVVAQGFDEAVQAFLRANVVPRRLREPRVAERLASSPPTAVPSPHGVLAAWRLGDGPAVLLVHGWEDDNSLWSPLVDELADGDRSLVAFDLPGHGGSGGEWGLGWQADGIMAVAGALGPIDALVAHSFGAGAAVGAMWEGLSVRRAVFVAPPLRSVDRWKRYQERLGVSDDVAEAARQLYVEAIGADRAALDVRAALPALDVELLVVHSTDDERNPCRDSREVVPRCPRAELLVVDGLTHRRTARDPDVVARIADFVCAERR